MIEEARSPSRSVEATEQVLTNGKSPQRKVHEPDNRASHYWLARYWAEALAAQNDNAQLAAHFAPLAAALADAEAAINSELVEAQGQPMDIDGYYAPDIAKATAAMRPSATLNAIFDNA